MKDYHFRAAGDLKIRFRTAHDLHADKNALLQFGAYIPGFALLDGRPDHIDLKLGSNWAQTNGIPEDTYHLLYGMVRKELLIKKDLCTIHGACVGLGDQFRLVVGHSGSGKTTLAQRLIDKHAMKLFSGNKTVLRFDKEGTITAIAGTRTMTALDKNQKRYAYELKAQQYETAQEVRISGIDIIRVNEGVKECQQLNPLGALHTLYPYVMDQVNADVITGAHQIFDGAVPSATKQKVVKGLSAALNNIPVRKISGSMDAMEEMVMS